MRATRPANLCAREPRPPRRLPPRKLPPPPPPPPLLLPPKAPKLRKPPAEEEEEEEEEEEKEEEEKEEEEEEEEEDEPNEAKPRARTPPAAAAPALPPVPFPSTSHCGRAAASAERQSQTFSLPSAQTARSSSRPGPEKVRSRTCVLAPPPPAERTMDGTVAKEPRS